MKIILFPFSSCFPRNKKFRKRRKEHSSESFFARGWKDPILCDHSWEEYSAAPNAHKAVLEAQLLADIVTRSHRMLNSDFVDIQRCLELLEENEEFRELLLDCWYKGTFDLIRTSAVLKATRANLSIRAQQVTEYYGGTHNYVAGNHYTLNEGLQVDEQRLAEFFGHHLVTCDLEVDALLQTQPGLSVGSVSESPKAEDTLPGDLEVTLPSPRSGIDDIQPSGRLQVKELSSGKNDHDTVETGARELPDQEMGSVQQSQTARRHHNHESTSLSAESRWPAHPFVQPSNQFNYLPPLQGKRLNAPVSSPTQDAQATSPPRPSGRPAVATWSASKEEIAPSVPPIRITHRPASTAPEHRTTPAPSNPASHSRRAPDVDVKPLAPFGVTTKRYRPVSQASMDATDGTVSTFMSSAESIHSSTTGRPSPPLPVRDPVLATVEWRNNEEVAHQARGKRRHRPGVVFDYEEEQPENSKQPTKLVRRGIRDRFTKHPSAARGG